MTINDIVTLKKFLKEDIATLPLGKIIEQRIEPLREKFNFKISQLGRGFSTGTEVEYSDPETLASALENRK
jgi:recombinational DNA repair protein RecR